MSIAGSTKQLAISSPRVIKCISINQNLNNLRNIFKVAHVWNIRDWMPGNRVMRCYQLPTSIVPHFSFYLSHPLSLTTKSDCCPPALPYTYYTYIQMKKKQLEQRFITRQPISLVQTNSKKLCSIYLASFYPFHALLLYLPWLYTLFLPTRSI